MTLDRLNIVMLMFQPSVVARGMEKKLKEMDNNVVTLVGDLSGYETEIFRTDVFIFHLPTRIVEETKEVNTMIEICEKIRYKNKGLILVGDRDIWDDLGRIYPGVSKYVWLFRPVEMNDLLIAISKVFTVAKPVEAKRRILIIDDDPAYAKVVREWIKDEYKVDIVTAGMQAITFLIKVADTEPVDLILLDYEMPIVDGPQVLQMLRTEAVTAKIPVVFLTGIGTRESVSRVMALKPDGYILKSTSREDLLAFLHEKMG
jgi:CheY-like chemotaxis protein